MMHLVAIGIIFAVWARASERSHETPPRAVPDEVLRNLGGDPR